MSRSARATAAIRSRRSMLVFIVFLLIGIIQPCQAGTFFDDFNDGNADGWVFPYYPSQSQGPGQWSVENGTLVQRFAGDGNRALVDNVLLSHQVIEVQARTLGYAGVVFWHQDNHYVAINHNYQTGMWVGEFFNGNYYGYSYGGPWIGGDTWYDLKVDADSESGDLAVYLDGVHLFTHRTSNPYRTGLSGVWSGNAVGYFDNFRLTSNDIPFNLDIKPEDPGNTISLRRMKTIPVAILSDASFSAPSEVDQASLTFGVTGDEGSFKSCARKAKDVNGDGYPDLVCTFSTKVAGFQPGDTEGILKGRMKTPGGLFEGREDVLVMP